MKGVVQWKTEAGEFKTALSDALGIGTSNLK